MNWKWHVLADGRHFCTPVSEHSLLHSLARLALHHEHLPRSSPLPCPYLTDIDPCVLLVISSVTDSQPQLLLAANTAQLHLLQENTQVCTLAFAKGGKNCVAQGSTKSLTYSYCRTYSYCMTYSYHPVSRHNILCASLREKIFCELRRKSQYTAGSSYMETVQ